jgi:hypothetical protein
MNTVPKFQNSPKSFGELQLRVCINDISYDSPMILLKGALTNQG